MSAMPPPLPPELAALLCGESSSASTPVAIGTPLGAEGEVIITGQGALKIGDTATVTDGSTVEEGPFTTGNTTILLHGQPLCGLGDLAIGSGKGIVNDVPPNLTVTTVLMSASGGGAGVGESASGCAGGREVSAEDDGGSDSESHSMKGRAEGEPGQLSETTGKAERAGDALNNTHTEARQSSLDERHNELSKKAEARQGQLDRAQRKANRSKNRRRRKDRAKGTNAVNHQKRELGKINKKIDEVSNALGNVKAVRLLGKAPRFIDGPVVAYEAGTLAAEGRPASAGLHIAKDVLGDAAGGATTGAVVATCAGAGVASGPAGPVVFGACVIVAVGGGIVVSEGVGALLDSTLGDAAEDADAGFQQYVRDTASLIGEGVTEAADAIVETVAEAASDVVESAVDHAVDTAKETLSDLINPMPRL